MNNILVALLWFAGIGGFLGLLLGIASIVFRVKKDEKMEKIRALLPGANCGSCGYPGCDGLAAAIAAGKASPSDCRAGKDENIQEIAKIMGEAVIHKQKMRAQVMCSGTHNVALKKYEYHGINDCVAAAKIYGGDKMCPYGCIGHGTCVRSCQFDAIHVVDGVAVVDPDKCTGCGMCTKACPKHIIKLIPADAKYYVACMSAEKGVNAMKTCGASCIGCKKCSKVCENGSISCVGFLASINYEKCIACGKCEDVCNRKIIRSRHTNVGGLMSPELTAPEIKVHEKEKVTASTKVFGKKTDDGESKK